MGKVDHINKRRKKSENVCVAFTNETEGETVAMFNADADEYGADRLWCLLKPIAIELSDSEDETLGDAAQKGADPTSLPSSA